MSIDSGAPNTIPTPRRLDGDEPAPGTHDALRDSDIVRRHLTTAAVLTAVVAVAPRLIHHPNAPTRARVVIDKVLGGWLRWDGTDYLKIATHGYSYRPHHASLVAFFPVYPLTVRLIGSVTPGGFPLASIMLTLVSGSVAFVLYHRWCRRRLSPAAARAAVIALAVYPFSWFLYGAAYSDALYLALVLGAFLLLEDDHAVLAGLVGAIATATRPTGITLVIGLVAVAADRRRRHLDTAKSRRQVTTVLVSLAGLGVWCAWLALRFGNPFAFIETEGAPGWNQPPGPHTWLKLDLISRLGSLPWPEAAAILFQGALAIGFLALVPAVARRLGRGYAIYAAAAIVIPAASSGDFLGVGRYLIAAFPVFAVIGAKAHTSRVAARTIASASASLLVVGTALFAAGFLVS